MQQLCIIRSEWDLKNRNVPFQGGLTSFNLVKPLISLKCSCSVFLARSNVNAGRGS